METKDVLKQRRIEKKLTLEDVARLVDVSAATISRWETGDIANMKRDKIVKLAKALDISPSVIMGWEDETSPQNNSLDYAVQYSEFDTNLRKAREQKGLSQREVAQELHTAPSTVAGWESGESFPSTAKLMQLAILYDVSTDYLLGLSPYTPPAGVCPIADYIKCESGTELAELIQGDVPCKMQIDLLKSFDKLSYANQLKIINNIKLLTDNY